DLISFTSSDKNKIKEKFSPSNTIFASFQSNEFERNPNLTLKASVAIQIIDHFQDRIKRIFSEDNINYVSPLRAHPKRYYMLDKAKLNLTLDTLDGDAIAEVLKD